MALILNIDTAQDIGLVALAENDRVLQTAISETQKDHASWVHEAIVSLLRETGYSIKELGAVGISNGPGSYTGLRIGLSTAKGLCYALNIPLVLVGTLEVMAFTAITAMKSSNSLHNGPAQPGQNILFCPMIDARRMEVFTAVYEGSLKEVMEPQALVLNPQSFQEVLKRQKMLFLGNGANKFQELCSNVDNAIFTDFPLNPSALAILIYRNFIGNNFAGLAYTEPLYLKEFFTVKTSESTKK